MQLNKQLKLIEGAMIFFYQKATESLNIYLYNSLGYKIFFEKSSGPTSTYLMYTAAFESGAAQ